MSRDALDQCAVCGDPFRTFNDYDTAHDVPASPGLPDGGRCCPGCCPDCNKENHAEH